MYFNFNNLDYIKNSYYLQNKELFIKLINVLNGKCISSIFKILNKSENKDILIFLKNSTEKMSESYSLSNRVFWIVNDIHDFPHCKIESCNKKLILPRYFKQFKYQDHCCNKCAQNDNKIKQKIKNTTFERHGNKNYRNIKKSKQTCFKHYGCENGMQSDIVKQKVKEHNLKKYGCEWITQSDRQKTQMKLNNLKKYNVENVFQLQKIKNKIKQTLLEKYGSEHTIVGVYLYKDIHFDSAPELAFYIWLSDNNINFEYHPNIFFNYEFNGKIYRYFPDFKIENQLIELKGNQFLKEDGTWKNPFDRSQDDFFEAKHQCALKNNVKILYSNDYKTYLDYIDDKYGKEYLKRFKK